MNKHLICGIIIAQLGSPREAQRKAMKFKDCPYLIMQAISSNKIYLTYIVPEKNRWWLKYPEDYPKEVGFQEAKVYIGNKIIVPQKFKPRLPLIKTKIAPCGADCGKCPLRDKYRCPCCPATIHYKG